MALQIEARNAAGEILAEPALSYWTSDTAVATVSSAGVLRSAGGLGAATLIVQADGGPGDTIALWVEPPPDDPGTFHITLLFAPDMPDAWREAMEAAARRWEDVIRAPLPEVILDVEKGFCAAAEGEPESPAMTGVETGVRVYVFQATFSEGTAEARAVAGPCLSRPLPKPQTVVGWIALNRLIPPDEPRSASLLQVAVHEMGHVLGVVGLRAERVGDSWNDPGVPWQDRAKGEYTGTYGLHGLRVETGDPNLDFVPTTGAHWTFAGVNDVMGWGLLNHISWISVGALMDHGYPAAWYGSGSVP